MGTFIVIALAILIYGCLIVRKMIEIYQAKGLIQNIDKVLISENKYISFTESVHFWTVILIVIIVAVVAFICYRKKKKNG